MDCFGWDIQDRFRAHFLLQREGRGASDRALSNGSLASPNSKPHFLDQLFEIETTNSQLIVTKTYN